MQVQKDHTQEQILKAARDAFLTHGFTKTTMRDVAHGAGVGLSNIYNYFENKEAIFRTLVQPLIDELNHLANAHQLLRQGTHRNSGLATLRLSKEWTDQGLTLQTFAYVDVSEGGIFDRSSADYALTDQLHLLLGYDLFHAQRGQFLVYRHNSEAWLKMKYSF